MKAASVSDVKKELRLKSEDELAELLMRMVKYKKENKELISYLLFDAEDESQYVNDIKLEIDLAFDEMNKSTIYFIKKSLRKVLRTANKHIKFSGQKTTEVAILLYFCKKITELGRSATSNVSVQLIYHRQIQKIEKALAGMHEDLRFDFTNDLNELNLPNFEYGY
ncbi:MAG: hypothetical protein ACOVOO_11840 [Flavobacteriales bacterium]|jgi:hypothetical protein